MPTPLGSAPLPWTPGAERPLPSWLPFALPGAAAILGPLVLAWRRGAEGRRRIHLSLAGVSVVGLALVSYALADAFLVQLDHFTHCPPKTLLPCPRPDPLLGLGMIGNLGLGIAFSVLLALEGRHVPRTTTRTDLALPSALLIGGAHLAAFAVAEGASQEARLAPLGSVALIYLIAAGFPILFFVGLRPDLLGGPWGRAVKGLGYLGGAASMAAAFALAYLALLPPPVL